MSGGDNDVTGLPQNWNYAQSLFDCASRVWPGDLHITAAHGARGDAYELRFPGPVLFAVDFVRKTVVATRGPAVSDDLLTHYFRNNVIPRILDHSGEFVLHAGGVAAGERALLLVGPSGAGKSTLAAALRESGLTLLGDDAVKVTASGTSSAVEAVYPSLRLNPDSIAAVMAGSGQWLPVADRSLKRRAVGLVHTAPPRPVKVAAVFFLEPSALAAIEIHDLPPAQSCAMLLEQSFMLDPQDLDRLKRRIGQAGRLSGSANCCRLVFPHDFARLAEVRQTILDRLSVIRS